MMLNLRLQDRAHDEAYLYVEVASFLIDHLKELAEQNQCTYQEELINRLRATFEQETALHETCEMMMPEFAAALPH